MRLSSLCALVLLLAGPAGALDLGDLIAARQSEERLHQRSLTAHNGAYAARHRVSETVARRSVLTMLRDSAILKEVFARPLTGRDLQREIQRIARETGDSGRLRELYAALGGDPALFAQLVARRTLAARLARDFYERAAATPSPAGSGGVGEMPADIVSLKKRSYEEWAREVALRLPSAEAILRDELARTGSYPYQIVEPAVRNSCQDYWTSVAMTGAPSPRYGHTAVWTGSEMIVWGGYDGSTLLNTGGRYDPVTDSWTTTSTVGAPAGREDLASVWTGSEMIVWGGYDGSTYSNSGGRYDPATDSWTPMTTVGAPTGRTFVTPVAVWTGSEMIVWGGYDGSTFTNTGGRYDPATDSWTSMTAVGAPTGRTGQGSVWTGSQMVVFGGFGTGGPLASGGRYSPSTDTWMGMNTSGSPVPRWSGTAVWTGSEMIIWGGTDGGNYLNSGGRYDPAADSWSSTSTAGAPTGRRDHVAIFSGNEMVVWGGMAGGGVYPTSGGRYDPVGDVWTATTGTNAPAGRDLTTGVSTGDAMIVWGGITSGGALNSGGIHYNATLTLPSSVPVGNQGLSYSISVPASGGTPPYSYAIISGQLPAGLTFDTVTAAISGTPTVAGIFPFTVEATDTKGCLGRQDYSLVVRPAVDYLLGKGHGPGNDNMVAVYTRAGQASGSLLAYGGGSYGANGAGGNIDGGSYDEILTGPGPGQIYGPQVRAFDRTMSPITKVNFYAYGTLRFGVNVAGAELDGDGFAEILSGAGPGDVFGPHVRGWNFDGSQLQPVQKISFFSYKTLKWGVVVDRGDLDGDGYDELLTGPGPGQIFGAQVRGWNYDGSSISQIGKINFNAYSTYKYGARVAGGDVDADVFAEILTAPGAGPSNPAEFRAFNYDGAGVSAIGGLGGTYFQTVYGGRVGAGDLLGDYGADLIAGSGPDPAAPATVVAYSLNGTSSTLVPGTPFNGFAGSYGVNVAGGAVGRF